MDDEELLKRASAALKRGKGTWTLGILKGRPALLVGAPTAVKVAGGLIVGIGLSEEDLRMLRDEVTALLEKKPEGAN
jgi:hypothetical protein